MNPFDFVKASAGGGSSLMPILVFAIWIAISVFSNAQKKKKRLEQKREKMNMQVPETHHSPEPAAPPGTMTQIEEKRTPVKDEVRPEWDGGVSKQQTNEKTAPHQTEVGLFSPETPAVERQSFEVPVPFHNKSEPHKVSRQPVSAVHVNAYDITIPQSDIDGIASSAITDAFSKEPQEKIAAQLFITREEVRKGIVWSEILALPVALRDTF